MDLNIEVADVDIDMGYMCNSHDTVRIEFRRTPDSDVRHDIIALKEKYGWEIKEGKDYESLVDRLLLGDFTIRCTGASSDEVGNAIGLCLEKVHGLRVRYCQFVKLQGKSIWTKGVEKLDLSAKVES